MRLLCAARRLRGAAGNSRARLLFALLPALLALAPAASAQTSVYHIRGNASAGSNNIWHVNLTTGVETAVYTGYPGGNAATLAQRPSDGMLFYVINSSAGSNGAVYRFNPATPSVAPVLLGNIGPSTSGANVSSGFRMAFNAAGTLYIINQNRQLYTAGTAGGAATLAGTVTFPARAPVLGYNVARAAPAAASPRTARPPGRRSRAAASNAA